MKSWPFTDTHVQAQRARNERLAEQLRVTMGYLDELRRHHAVVKSGLADVHVDRQHEIRTARAAFDAVLQEQMLAQIADIEKQEREVRDELAAAHARATGHRPARPLTEARRALVNARAAESSARERVTQTYDRAIGLQRGRRRAAIVCVSLPLVWLVASIVFGVWTWALAVLALAVVAGVFLIRWLDLELGYAREAIGKALELHGRLFDELLLAEAEFRIAGGDITRI